MKITLKDIVLVVEVFCKHFSVIEKEGNSLHRKVNSNMVGHTFCGFWG